LVDKIQDIKCLNFSQKLAVTFAPKVNKYGGELAENNHNYLQKSDFQTSKYAKKDSRP